MEGAIPEMTLGTVGITVPGITVLRVVIVTAGTTAVVVGTIAAAVGPEIVIERMAVGILLAQAVVRDPTVVVGTAMIAAVIMIAATTILETVADGITAMGEVQTDTVEDHLAVDATIAGTATTEAGAVTIEAETATIHGIAIRGTDATIGVPTVETAASMIAVVTTDVVRTDAMVGVDATTIATVAMMGITRTRVIAIVVAMRILAIK